MAGEQAETVQRARILIVDDEEIIHASLKRVFHRLGLETEAVLTAESALARLNEAPFNLIMLDLMMPEMNGLQFLAALREKDIQLPVIMITGYPTVQTAVEALRLGAADYVTKPFTREEILGPVQKALSLTKDVVPAEVLGRLTGRQIT